MLLGFPVAGRVFGRLRLRELITTSKIPDYRLSFRWEGTFRGHLRWTLVFSFVLVLSDVIPALTNLDDSWNRSREVVWVLSSWVDKLNMKTL